ncbi:MAG: winged helix-turn-helix transcriptional regulator [Christensenellaceae bacterium]|nr:winged helix-turn-helix transcriptional regulator [Christensenellaceae bacterium]
MQIILKAMADETRLKILNLLLANNYCVGALAKNLDISEAAVSQHLKVLREAGLLSGQKKGYYMHYSVNRNVLRDLADKINKLADIECKACLLGQGECFEAVKNSKGYYFNAQNADDEVK